MKTRKKRYATNFQKLRLELHKDLLNFQNFQKLRLALHNDLMNHLFCKTKAIRSCCRNVNETSPDCGFHSAISKCKLLDTLQRGCLILYSSQKQLYRLIIWKGKVHNGLKYTREQYFFQTGFQSLLLLLVLCLH